MGRLTRVVIALAGAAAAVLIPAAVRGLGIPLFWSQGLGIAGGSLLMFIALMPTRPRTSNIYVPWAIALTVATVIALIVHRLLGLES